MRKCIIAIMLLASIASNGQGLTPPPNRGQQMPGVAHAIEPYCPSALKDPADTPLAVNLVIAVTDNQMIDSNALITVNWTLKGYRHNTLKSGVQTLNGAIAVANRCVQPYGSLFTYIANILGVTLE